jgi:hypothetical protein
VADEARILGSDTQEGERELVTPSVRRLRPESRDMRFRSGDAGASERQRQDELTPAFQRRWEVVQTVFVARGR